MATKPKPKPTPNLPAITEQPFINLGGRPAVYESVNVMAAKAEDYFRYCLDHEKTPSKIGLATYLGMGRSTLHQYSAKPGFSDLIKRCDDIIESSWVDLCSQNRNNAGVIFILKNHYDYRDVKDVNFRGTLAIITDEQIAQRLDAMAEMMSGYIQDVVDVTPDDDDSLVSG